MAQRSLKPGSSTPIKVTREYRQADGKWRSTPTESGMRWRARSRVKSHWGVDTYRQGYGNTRGEAIIECQERIETFLESGNSDVHSDMLVSELGESWLRSRKADMDRGSLAYNSFSMYSRTWNSYLLPRLKDLRVREVGATTAETVLKEVIDQNGFGAAEKAKSIFSLVWHYAMNADAATRNPASKINIKRRATSSGERYKVRLVDALSAEQVAKLREHIHNPLLAVSWDVRILIEIGLGTGARIGEICALQWSNVDLEAGTIHVQHTMVRRKGEGLHLSPTKTANSVRTLAISRRLVELLREHQQSQRITDGMVLHSKTGQWADPTNLMGQLRPVFLGIGFTGVTSHTLRRTVGTMLINAGRPINEVSDHLGHSDVATTLRHYVGRNTQGSSAAADILG